MHLEGGYLQMLHPSWCSPPMLLQPAGPWGLLLLSIIGIMAQRIWILFWSERKTDKQPHSHHFQVVCSNQKCLPLTAGQHHFPKKKEFAGIWKILWYWINQESYIKSPFPLTTSKPLLVARWPKLYSKRCFWLVTSCKLWVAAKPALMQTHEEKFWVWNHQLRTSVPHGEAQGIRRSHS